MRVLTIKHDTTVDGIGFRDSIYTAGCSHKCAGCHNPESWDFSGGSEMSVDDVFNEICLSENNDVTITGGDPLFQSDETMLLCDIIKKKTSKNIWIYTGFKFEYIIKNKKLYDAIKYADVLVDGTFDIKQKDINLYFRGSKNQRIIDIQSSIKYGAVIEIDYNPIPLF